MLAALLRVGTKNKIRPLTEATCATIWQKSLYSEESIKIQTKYYSPDVDKIPSYV